MQPIRKQQGFSLVEMMLAMALGLIVVTGIVQLFIGNSQSSNVISGQARLQENARFAFEFMSAAARRAGYFGCLSDDQTRVWGLVGAPAQLPEYNIDQPVAGFEAQGGGNWLPSIVNLPGGTPGNTNAGGTIYDTDRLGVGGVSHERGKAKVARIYDNMQRVFEIADRDKLPTYQAADRMAEERISQIAEVKKYVDDF